MLEALRALVEGNQAARLRLEIGCNGDESIMEGYVVRPIGFIRSGLRNVADAPRFYTEGAPNAPLELLPAFRDGLERVEPGQDIIVITWLHLAQRDVLKVHLQGTRHSH